MQSDSKSCLIRTRKNKKNKTLVNSNIRQQFSSPLFLKLSVVRIERCAHTNCLVTLLIGSSHELYYTYYIIFSFFQINKCSSSLQLRIDVYYFYSAENKSNHNTYSFLVIMMKPPFSANHNMAEKFPESTRVKYRTIFR